MRFPDTRLSPPDDRPPPPDDRPPIRNLLLTVAGLAVVLGVTVGLCRRSESFQQAALSHAREAEFYVFDPWGLTRLRNLDGTEDPGNATRVKQYRRLYHHHRRLKEKYERAAARPWLPVAPDPPPPPFPYLE
jgi:hypothetical protein